MSKDRKYTIRINSAEIEYYEANLPPEVGSLAELFRSGAKKLVEGDDSSSSSVNIDINRIGELIAESEKRILSEIEQNRLLVMSQTEAMQAQKVLDKSTMKKITINQLVNQWLEKPVLLSTYSTIEELEKSIKYNHLRIVFMDALDDLSKRQFVTVSPGGKLKWSLE